MKYLLLVSTVFFGISLAAYNPVISSELIYMSNIAYYPLKDIRAWNCSECKKFNVTDVSLCLTQLKGFENTTRDMQGFVAYLPKNNTVIVAFRGSVDIKNWIDDFDALTMAYPKCSNCRVHVGFYQGYMEIAHEIKSQVQLILGKYRDAQIHVTGHSLGGAMAVVAALDLKSTFGKVDHLYTFGQPRVGNQHFADYLASEIASGYRVVHYADIVPHVPPLDMLDYRHGGAQIWYTEDMQTYQVCTAEDPKCMDSLPESKWSANDHDSHTYAKLPASIFQLLGLRRNDY